MNWIDADAHERAQWFAESGSEMAYAWGEFEAAALRFAHAVLALGASERTLRIDEAEAHVLDGARALLSEEVRRDLDL